MNMHDRTATPSSSSSAPAAAGAAQILSLIHI